jgi:hypothetical protein
MPLPSRVTITPPDPQGRPDSASAGVLREALAAAFGELNAAPAPAPPRQRADLAALRDALVAALDPRRTIDAAYRQRLRLAAGLNWAPADPLEPVQAAPEFPQPMFEPLRDLSQDWLLPGLDQVPPNTIALLETNQRFVEAYMVGLNHEMARELLWNEYPTDQRGTYFRQFWDPSGIAPAPGAAVDPETLRDIRPIHRWPKTAPLGANSPRPPPPAGGQRLVLLVRGELLRRYPGALVYAVQARPAGDGQRRDLDTAEQHPTFSGTLDPDVAFYGFDLTVAEARGDAAAGNPGWFFVLQEQVSAPRFGLDLAARAAPPPPQRWDELTWEHLGPGVDYIDLNAALPDTRQVVDPGGPGAVWHADGGLGPAGARASDLAYITLQRPVRVAVHASALLPPQ